MYPIIALPHCPATARHILPLEDTRQAAHLQRRNIMPEPATAPVVPPTVFRKGLLLHCGAEVIDRRTLSRVETPSCTESWFPIPHDFLLKEVESQLTAHGFGIGETTHALSHEGKRYFGVLQILRPDDGPDDYSWIVGIRNSHDKTFPASLVMGTRVFVCDNLAFTSCLLYTSPSPRD